MINLFVMWTFLLLSAKFSSGLLEKSNLDYSQCEATEMLPVNPFVSASEKIEVFVNISRLGVAIVRNKTQEIESLLSGICDPNDNKTLYSPSCCGWGGVPLTTGLSSLHIAVMTGNLFALEKLLEAENIAVNSQDENGETPLVYALRFGTENRQFFMPTWHHLGFGAHLGPFGTDHLTPYLPDYLTPEVPEVKEGQEVPEVIETILEMLNLLVDGGANLNAVNKDQETVLMQAVLKQHEKVIQLLVNGGANLDAVNEYGETALMLAAVDGQAKVVRLLVDNGAALDAVDKNGETALIKAVLKRQEKVVQFLVDGGANIDIVNNYGETALMLSAVDGQEEVVQILVDGEADLDTINNDGETALLKAVVNGHEKVVQFLINKGADSKGLDINIDYSGHGLDGYGWKQIFEVSKCCEECQLVADCTHWTMVRLGGEGNGCWLKTEQGEKSEKIGAISGSKENCFI